MHTGMLWFDNSTTALDVKIQKAIDYYKKKYGRTPNLCFVHPSMMPDFNKRNEPTKISGLPVRPYRLVLPGYIWIGIADTEAA